MREIGLKPLELNDIAVDLLRKGHNIRFTARGASMRPFVRDGDVLEVGPLDERPIIKGDIVLYACDGYPVVHRVVATRQGDEYKFLTTKGDASVFFDTEITLSQVYGRVIWVIKNGRKLSTESRYWRTLSRAWISFLKVRRLIRRLKTSMSRRVRK